MRLRAAALASVILAQAMALAAPAAATTGGLSVTASDLKLLGTGDTRSVDVTISNPQPSNNSVRLRLKFVDVPGSQQRPLESVLHAESTSSPVEAPQPVRTGDTVTATTV